MVFGNEVKDIQAAAYNGVRTISNKVEKNCTWGCK